MSNSSPAPRLFRRWLYAAAIAMCLAPAAPAFAQSTATLGKPAYGGTGCPAGTASATLSRDGTTLTVRFSAYQVAAGGATGKTFDRKACGLSIPLSVPAGLSVSLLDMDFTGTNRLPSGAKSTFTSEAFFPGGQGPKLSKSYNGPQTGRFTTGTTTPVTAWTACGADTILRNNSSIRVTTTGGKAASASIRSQDVQTALVFHLRTRRC